MHSEQPLHLLDRDHQLLYHQSTQTAGLCILYVNAQPAKSFGLLTVHTVQLSVLYQESFMTDCLQRCTHYEVPSLGGACVGYLNIVTLFSKIKLHNANVVAYHPKSQH